MCTREDSPRKLNIWIHLHRMDLPIHHTGPEKVAMMHFTRTILISRLFIFKDSQTFVWIALAVDKANRHVVPPLKISDIPYSRPNADRDYRAIKIRVQFQCPLNTGLFTWKIYIVSDTFIADSLFLFYFWFRESFRLALTHLFYA